MFKILNSKFQITNNNQWRTLNDQKNGISVKINREALNAELVNAIDIRKVDKN